MGARRAFGQREQKREMAGGGTRKQAWNQSLLEAKSQPPSGPFFLQKKAQLFLPPEQLKAGQSCHWSSQSHITRGVQVARTLLSLSSRRGLLPSGWGSGQRVVCVCVCVFSSGRGHVELRRQCPELGHHCPGIPPEPSIKPDLRHKMRAVRNPEFCVST